MFHLILMAAVLCAAAGLFLGLRPIHQFFHRPLLPTSFFLTAAFLPATAMAATPSTLFDASYWWQFVLAVASAGTFTLFGLLAAWAKQHFKLAAGSSAASILDLFVTAGAQAATALIAKAPTTAVIDVKNQAIAGFLTTISDTTKSAMTLKGVTAADLAQRIDGEVALRMGVSTPPAAVLAPAPSPAIAPAK